MVLPPRLGLGERTVDYHVRRAKEHLRVRLGLPAQTPRRRTEGGDDRYRRVAGRRESADGLGILRRGGQAGAGSGQAPWGAGPARWRAPVTGQGPGFCAVARHGDPMAGCRPTGGRAADPRVDVRDPGGRPSRLWRRCRRRNAFLKVGGAVRRHEQQLGAGFRSQVRFRLPAAPARVATRPAEAAGSAHPVPVAEERHNCAGGQPALVMWTGTLGQSAARPVSRSRSAGSTDRFQRSLMAAQSPM